MGRIVVIILLIGLVLGLPFLLQDETETIGEAQDAVIVITPHNEAIRFEFENAFREWYEERTGRTVDVDWRVIGGTSEIVRYVNSEFENAFRLLWTDELGRDWTGAIRENFANRRHKLPTDRAEWSDIDEARAAFLDSGVSVGLDVFFGGGSYDFQIMAGQGFLVPWRTEEARRALVPTGDFPMSFSGEPVRDGEGRWIGAVLSGFGIVYNKDVLERLGFEGRPSAWSDLADPRLLGEVALADPTKSGSITKAFEMVVQERMQVLEARYLAEGLAPEEAAARAVPEGWNEAMALIQRIAANARYFTDSATKPALDVASGDCAAGMAIDFYGRYQAEVVANRSGRDRMGFVIPEGASTLSADPIGIFRGAPNPEVADLFLEFVMSEPGQKLWGYRVGTPGGPIQYALRRNPGPRSFYEPPRAQYLSEPDLNPYEVVSGFEYRSEWTGRLFTPLRFVIRTAFIDPHDELREAWRAIQAARERGETARAEEALAVFSDLSRIDYAASSGPIAEILGSRDKIEEVRLGRELAEAFRDRYRLATAIAEGRDR